MQLWVKETGQKVLIIFEGRDAADKGGAIKRFNEHLNPRGARTVALEKPTEEEASQWYFQCYIQHLEFMRETPELERMLVNSGVHIIKFWFSVSQREQLNRFAARETDPVRRWKLSPTDLASLDKWDDYTNAKEAMFFYTHTADAPWTVVKSNDCQGPLSSAHRRPVFLPAGGHQNCPLVASWFARLGGGAGHRDGISSVA